MKQLSIQVKNVKNRVSGRIWDQVKHQILDQLRRQVSHEVWKHSGNHAFRQGGYDVNLYI